jgi:hypothetical protein
MSAIGTKQTLVCVATISALEVSRSSIGPEKGYVCGAAAHEKHIF